MDQHISIHNCAAQSTARIFYISCKRQLRSLQNVKNGDIAIVVIDRKGMNSSYVFQNDKWILMDEVDLSDQ